MGPSGHGQRNKAHKPGRHASAGSRKRHRLAKEGPTQRASVKAAGPTGKHERLLAARNQRDAKRQELLEKRRKGLGSPVVVAILPLSDDVDVPRLWRDLTAACARTGADSALPTIREDEAVTTAATTLTDDPLALLGAGPLGATTLSVVGRSRLRLTLLPPPARREDPLEIIELGKAAEVLLLAVPGDARALQVDPAGDRALAVLRALGLPGACVAVQSSGAAAAGGRASASAADDEDAMMVVDEAGGKAAGSGAQQQGQQPSMKARAAAKKRVEKAVGAHLAGELKIFHADAPADFSQLVRHLAEHPPAVPHWRHQRPALMVESAEFKPAAAAAADAAAADAVGTLLISGFVRCAGLSANQLITIPGAGDFQIDLIEGPEDPYTLQPQARGAGSSSMDTTGSQPVVLAQADPEERDEVVRENEVEEDPMGGEQTWPSEKELEDAAAHARRLLRKRVPAGTSEYQAAWIPDDECEELSEIDEEDEEDDEMGEGTKGRRQQGSEGMSDDDLPELEDIPGDDDPGTDGMAMDDDDDEDKWRAVHDEIKAKRMAEAEDAEYPDEVEVPTDVPARVRFQKYKGLKSFRSSPWDNKEWLPAEYQRVFAFENFKRAHKRAKEAVARASSDADPFAVAAGTYVRIHVANVPADKAQAVIERVAACFAPGSQAASASNMPLVAFGLMQHECKMSVVNMGVKKVAAYSEPVRNKEELLIVTGLRSFTACPILSTDTHGDKHKMERFLHPGQHCVATCFAPISYPPLPVLLFKVTPGRVPQLAATGGLRSCDPDRVVLKKIVLTGYPVRVHKRRATVRFMFHTPEDISWFRPVELFTRSGRRGRITEPLGTHGAMKCMFDGPVQQRESVCMSLYKRVFPRWPKDLSFA